MSTQNLALTVRPKADSPQHWAEAQVNLARLHADWSEHDSFYFDKATKRKAEIKSALAERTQP